MLWWFVCLNLRAYHINQGRTDDVHLTGGNNQRYILIYLNQSPEICKKLDTATSATGINIRRIYVCYNHINETESHFYVNTVEMNQTKGNAQL